MDLPDFLSSIFFKKHLSRPGAAEEALEFVQKMRARPIKIETVGNEECEIKELPYHLNACTMEELNDIIVSVRRTSNGQFKGKIRFDSPREAVIRLYGPAYIVGGDRLEQVSLVLEKSEAWLTDYIEKQKGVARGA